MIGSSSHTRTEKTTAGRSSDNTKLNPNKEEPHTEQRYVNKLVNILTNLSEALIENNIYFGKVKIRQ